jgi:hypothetical protein
MAAWASLRPGMRWALGLSVLASGLALWSASTPPEPSAPNSSLEPHTAPARTNAPSPSSPLTLPAQMASLELERAERDPFELPPPPPPPAPVVVAAPPAPPPPSAPAISYRYLGQMLDLQGQRQIYLVRSDNKEVRVERGTRLDEGYVVEAITTTEIKLVYEPLQQRVNIPIPAANPS